MRRLSIRNETARSNRFFLFSASLPISVTPIPARPRRQGFRRSSSLRRVICGVDALLRLAQSVFEFSASEDCLLRIAVIRADAMVHLANGVVVKRGEPVVSLHLWNEHLPALPDNGPNFAWVNRIRWQMLGSLRELAVYAEISPELHGVSAFHARIAFASRGRREKMIRIAARFGFERIAPDHQPPLGRQIHDFFENFWLWGLVWTFNPRSLRRRALQRQRDELWISKADLIDRFGTRRMLNEFESS
jgi:hypothetical protein